MRFSKTSAAAVLPLAAAQTFTSCNPLEKTCPADTGLSTSTYSVDFTQGSSAASSWSQADGTSLNYGSNGAEFTINKAGQAPTVSTDFYIFFGRVDVTMQAAPGTGIVSSIVLESDDLDEIDWEFLGGNTTTVETNFFGKGNTTTYDRAIYYNVADPQSTFHTYSIDWSPEQLEFIIDGVTVRTIPYSTGITVNGANYPQTPMRLKLGNWAGGAPGQPEGTVEWAGGKTDFSQAPFSMYVKSVNIQNYKPASSYVYGDNSGSWESIQLVNGGSTSSAGSSTASSTASSSASGSASGSASSSASGSSSGSSSGSATKKSTATTAPTSMISVAPITGGKGVAQTTTVIGSSYSTNSASIAALNTGSNDGTAASTTASSTPSPSSSTTPSQNGAASSQIMAAGSLLSVALGFLFLL